jgi:hypothetical protein
MAAYKIARLGMAHVVEGRGVFSSLTVEENLTLAFRQRAGRKLLAGKPGGPTAPFPILGERRRQLAGTLSGGQQRLLSLAKVLVVPPKVLVADELSLGLGPGGGRHGVRGPDRKSIATGRRDWWWWNRCRGSSLASSAVVWTGVRWPIEGDPAGAGKA